MTARDRILFQESIEKQKVLQIAEKDQKNLDQASIDSLNKRLFSEHEKIGRASGSQEFDDFARNALRNAQGGGIGGSMNGKSMDIPDVEQLMPQEEEEEEGADEDDDGAGEDEAKEEATTPKKKPKKANDAHMLESMVSRYLCAHE